MKTKLTRSSTTGCPMKTKHETFATTRHRAISALTLAALTVLVTALTCLAGLDDGLVAYYPLNTNATDASGNGNNATPQGGVSFVPGLMGGAAHFGDINDYIECNSTAVGNFGQSNFSLSCWVKTTSGGPLVSKRVTCDAYYSFVDLIVGRSMLLPPSPVPQTVLFETCGGGGLSNYYYAESPLTFGDALWHHIAVLRNGNKLVTYVDGIRTAETNTAQIANIQNSEPLRIGRSACSGVDPTPVLVGEIDEVRIYNRALSSVEVRQLYSEGQLNIAVSQVRLCWQTLTNKTYQVQYRTNLSLDSWVNLGSAIPGNDSTQCVTDDIVTPQRFYRVVPSP
jgi:hypothetical protein